MNDVYYAELEKAQNQINKILLGDDYDEIVRITGILVDTMELIQTIAIVLERATFLDAYVKIGDYTDKLSIGEIGDIFQIYIDNVELAMFEDKEIISDDKILKKFTAKCLESKRDSITMLSMLISIAACMSLKNKEPFDRRYGRLVMMLPDKIRYAYEEERLSNLEHILKTGVIMNYETLRKGERSFPKDEAGYSLVCFVDDSIYAMERSTIGILVALLPEEDLVNVMGVISGRSRKKIMDSLDYEDTFRISQKVFLYSFTADGKSAGILSDEEIYSEVQEVVLPSIKKAIEKIIFLTYGKFKYICVHEK